MGRIQLGVWLSFGLTILPATARGAQYAAMNEVPVTGGELRLKVERQGGEFAFPLKHTSVSVAISGMMAETRVIQRFTNPFSDPVEAVYVFPVGADAAVIEYELVIGKRTVKGVIRRAAQARRGYERARARGKTAALLQQDRPNVFTQSVANIPAGEEVVVRFKLVERLRYDSGWYSYVMPMVVGPRFRPPGTEQKPITYVRPGERAGAELDLKLTLDAGVPIEELRVPTHSVQVQRSQSDRSHVSVTLAQADRVPNKDFVLRYRTAGARSMLSLLAHREGSQGYFILVAQPKARFKEAEVVSREMVLVLDRSGSMHGAPMRQARLISTGLLGTLTPRDTFTVVDFADSVGTMAFRPVQASPANLGRGRAYIANLAASGGTLMLKGVAAALARSPGKGRLRLIYLISDGYIGNGEQVLAAAKTMRGLNRIFTVGVGSSPNRHLMDRLAEVGRGFSSYLTLKEDPWPLVKRLVQRSAYPYLSGLSIEWGGLAVRDLTRLPADLYVGQPLVVAGRYAGPGKGTIQLHGWQDGQKRTSSLEVTLPERRSRPALAHLWARQRIHQLMASQYGRVSSQVEREVTRLGLEYSIVTRYTSFLAVDESPVAVARGETPRRLVQSAPLPEGMAAVDVVRPDPPPAEAVAALPSPAPSSAPPPPVHHPRPTGPSHYDHHSGRSSWGGGGGDVDPLLLVTLLGFLPFARRLRRR